MRAVIVRSTGGPEVLQIELVPDPVPALDEAPVKVTACGMCTLDVVTRRGTYRRPVESWRGRARDPRRMPLAHAGRAHVQVESGAVAGRRVLARRV